MDLMETGITLTPEQTALALLLERALQTGAIRRDRLQTCLQHLGLTPEDTQVLWEWLQAKNIRVISDVEDPEYDPPLRLTLQETLLLRGYELSERKRQVLTMRIAEQKTLQETAAQLGLTRERVRQIESCAIRQLTHRSLTRRKKISEFYE